MQTSKKALLALNPEPIQYDKDGIPTFNVIAQGKFYYPVPNQDGTRNTGCHLVFACPKCKQKIAHGGTFGKKGDGDGHRVSHCQCWDDGYYIKEI